MIQVTAEVFFGLATSPLSLQILSSQALISRVPPEKVSGLTSLLINKA